MKSVVIIIGFCLLLGGLAFAGVYSWKKARVDHAHAHMTSFDWCCQEFAVTAEQRQRIAALHASYFPECEDHCVHYAGTRETLAEILDDPDLNSSPIHEQVARELKALEKEADQKFLDFIYAVSTEMDPVQAERYLQRMKGWLDQVKETGK